MASGRKQSNMGSLHSINRQGLRAPKPVTSIHKGLADDIDPVELPSLMDLKPITRSLHPDVRQNAFFKDRYEGKLNALDELEQGNRLSEHGLAQLDHAFDLAEYSRVNPKTPEQKNLLNQSRKQLRDAIAQNDFLRVLREPGQDPLSPTFKYKGLEIPKENGVALMREEHQKLLTRNDWLMPFEVAQKNEEISEAKGSAAPHMLLQGRVTYTDHYGRSLGLPNPDGLENTRENTAYQFIQGVTPPTVNPNHRGISLGDALNAGSQALEKFGQELADTENWDKWSRDAAAEGLGMAAYGPLAPAFRNIAGLGEQASGRYSNVPPSQAKEIMFNNELELSGKLFKSHREEQGYPRSIDLGRLDFSNNINVNKLDSVKNAVRLVNAGYLKPEILEKATGEKVDVKVAGDLVQLTFKRPFTDITMNIPEIDPKFVPFGRIGADVDGLSLIIDRKKGTVQAGGKVYPRNSLKLGPDQNTELLLDTFDFNPDISRSWLADTAVRTYKKYAPSGSTAFKLFAKPNSYSNYSRTYQINDF